MKMDTKNSGTGNYYIYTDQILLDTESVLEYAEQTRVVSCERDSVNVTNNYDYCTAAGETDPDADGTTWAMIFALLALLLITAGLLTFMEEPNGNARQD